MNQFFVLEPEEGILFGTKWAYADIIIPVNRGECELCPECGEPVSGRKWLPPYKIKLSSSKTEKWGDFLWGAGFPLLVSERFKINFNLEKLTGILNFSGPIEISSLGRTKAEFFPNPLPVYYLVDIPWGGANQDDLASHVIRRDPEITKCSYHRGSSVHRKQDQVVIDVNSWNGTDIFIPRGAPVRYMVSERFKIVAQKYQFKNILLIPGEEYGYDDQRLVPWFRTKK